MIPEFLSVKIRIPESRKGKGVDPMQSKLRLLGGPGPLQVLFYCSG